MPRKLLVSGANAIEEILALDMPIRRAWCTANKSLPQHWPSDLFKRVSRPDLDGIIHHQYHHGLVVETLIEEPEAADLVDACGPESPLVVLDGIEDPQNLGTIVRAATGLGAAGVVTSRRKNASLTDSVVRASAGVALRKPPAFFASSVAQFILGLEKQGIACFGLALEGTLITNDFQLPSGPWALVVGNEASGLSHLVRERCSSLVRLPLSSEVESFNAAVASALGLYALGQRP